jgi:glycosyltransferase involved in cell wall biosynthesis
MTPDITVVLPTRNRRAMLARTLGAVLAQRDVDLEVVVVDEASTDDTPAFLAALGDPRVRCVRHDQPQGVSAARNRGLAEARGRWVAFTDDDDLWAPDKLAAQIDALARTPGARWSGVGAVTVDADLQVLNSQHAPIELDVGGISLVYNMVPGGGSGVLVETALAREVGGFDPSLSMIADWEMWIRLARSSPVAGVDRPLLAYVLHPGGMSQGASRARHEFREIEARYRVERRRAGYRFPWAHYLEWMFEMDLRAGRRGAACRLAVEQCLRQARPALAKRAFGSLVAPGVALRRRERFVRAGLVPAWREAADAWLDPLRGPLVLQPLPVAAVERPLELAAAGDAA